METDLIHGTCIAAGPGPFAVLFRGDSGAGKSDLAFRCLGLRRNSLAATLLPPYGTPAWNTSAKLVSDDQVELNRHENTIIAKPPRSIAGKIELRGIGIFDVEALSRAQLVLVIDLVAGEKLERMPQFNPDKAAVKADQTVNILGITLTRISLSPFDCSAPQKVLLALQLAASRLPQ